ncbi:hypothetical protein P154DRAFT_597544 [Amniculicola lignicola CBS 123094]|uniref:Uncharacterized protein n=1 Tax=Amniculicola lignicola CBS 123094 TaxID=1392246 RepID=A0A6A5X0W1_9PLEO|nr:hypothetical protein P154DRAFT_597544 [Amniculicola lignicola CBS 123094]
MAKTWYHRLSKSKSLPATATSNAAAYAQTYDPRDEPTGFPINLPTGWPTSGRTGVPASGSTSDPASHLTSGSASDPASFQTADAPSNFPSNSQSEGSYDPRRGPVWEDRVEETHDQGIMYQLNDAAQEALAGIFELILKASNEMYRRHDCLRAAIETDSLGPDQLRQAVYSLVSLDNFNLGSISAFMGGTALVLGCYSDGIRERFREQEERLGEWRAGRNEDST